MNGFRESPNKYLGYLTFAGLFALVAAYYIVHKPITPARTQALVEAVWAVVVALSITTIAGGVGRSVLRLENLNPPVRLPIQAGLGFGLIGIAGLLVGGLGGFTRPVAWVLLLTGLIALRRQAAGWWKDWSCLAASLRDLDGTCRAIGLLCLVILFMTGASTLAPPLKFDTLVYHLSLPRHYSESAGINYIGENIFWGMPQTGEMTFTWAMLLSGDTSATLMGWMWGFLTIVGLFGFIGAKFGKRAAFVGVASLFSGYSISAGLSWGYVDWLAMLFGTGFLLSLVEYRQERNRIWLITSAAFAGFTLGTKYTGGLLFFSGVLFLLFSKVNQVGVGRRLANCLVWTVAAVLFAAPWLLKNFLATGNPAYPFFIPSGAMDSYRLGQYHGSPVESLVFTLLFLPLRATLAGAEATPGYGASIGPLLLGFSLSAGLGWKKLPGELRGVISSAMWVALPGTVAWIFASRFSDFLLQSRLYYSIFPALTVLAAAGFYNLEQYYSERIKLGWIAGVATVFVLALTAFEIAGATIQQGSLQVLLGQKSRDQYLDANLGWYNQAMLAVKDLPAGGRVVMLWEPRSYYCQPRCVPDEILDAWLRLRHSHPGATSGESAEILHAWRQKGYTHLLVNQFGADFVRAEENEGYQADDWSALEDLTASLPLVQDFGSTYYLYSLAK